MARLRRGRREVRKAGARSPILLASEGRPFGEAVLCRAAALAAAAGAEIRVLSVARIWGTSFGFPNPWLMPSEREWQQQRNGVAAAIAALAAEGVAARGEVVATRDAARRITRAAGDLGCTAIVMAAEPRRSFLLSNLLWSQEPHRVARRTRIPVHLVPVNGVPGPQPERGGGVLLPDRLTSPALSSLSDA